MGFHGFLQDCHAPGRSHYPHNLGRLRVSFLDPNHVESEDAFLLWSISFSEFATPFRVGDESIQHLYVQKRPSMVARTFRDSLWQAPNCFPSTGALNMPPLAEEVWQLLGLSPGCQTEARLVFAESS